MYNQSASPIQRSNEPQVGSRMAPDYTHLDLSSALGAVQSSGGLNVQFFYERVRIGGDSGPQAGTFQTRLCVALQPKGDRLTVAVENITPAIATQRFPREWHHFETYQDVPTAGTPLHELPGISQSMIAQLVLNGIRAVEDLVNLPQEIASNIGLDAITARNIAINWTDLKTKAAPTLDLADKASRAELELAQLKAQMAALQQTNLAQAGTIEAIKAMGGIPNANAQATPGEAIPMDRKEAYEAVAPSDIFGAPELVTGNDDLNMADPLAD